MVDRPTLSWDPPHSQPQTLTMNTIVASSYTMDWDPSSTMPRMPEERGRCARLLGEAPTPPASPPALTAQEAPDLVGPPLHAQHEHAGDGQAEEGAPVLQALQGPP